MLRLKRGVDVEVLRDFGFMTGGEWIENHKELGDFFDYQGVDTFWLFDLDENDGQVTFNEFHNPVVSMNFHMAEDELILWIDCVLFGTCHIGGWELDTVTNTIFQMTCKGLLEPEASEEEKWNGGK